MLKLALIGLIASIVACNNITNRKEQLADTTTTIDLSNTIQQKIIVDELKMGIGKTVTEVHWLDSSVITARLKKLMADDYSKMLKSWNVETPITKQGNILHASGCKKHNCPSDSYDLFVDLKNDDINVYNIKGHKLVIYKERDVPIELTGELFQEMDTKKINADIKSASYKRYR